jgi:hypothetical protein
MVKFRSCFVFWGYVSDDFYTDGIALGVVTKLFHLAEGA